MNPPDTSRTESAGFTDFFQTLGRPAVYYPSLAKMFKSIKAAAFIGQLMYWSPRASDPDGWVYKTVDEWTAETGMTYQEQRHARQHLIRLRVLEEHHDRQNHRFYFRVNRKILNDLCAIWFAAYPPEGGHMGKYQVPPGQRPDGHMGKGQVAPRERSVRIRNRDDSEMTSREEATPRADARGPDTVLAVRDPSEGAEPDPEIRG